MLHKKISLEELATQILQGYFFQDKMEFKIYIFLFFCKCFCKIYIYVQEHIENVLKLRISNYSMSIIK